MNELPRWPVERIEEILDLFQGGAPLKTTFRAVLPSILGPRDLEAWLYAAASARGVEAEPINARGHELEQVIAGAAPAIVVAYRSVLAVRRVRGDRVTLLCPEGGERTVPMSEVIEAVGDLWKRRYALPSIEGLLQEAGVPEDRRRRTRQSFLRKQLATRPLEVGWSVHLAPSAPLWAQLQEARQGSTVLKLGLALFLGELATVVAWTLFGRGALLGQLDRGWLIAWGLALITAACLQVLATFWQGTLSIKLGALFKKRVFLGALRIDHEELRQAGLGQSMGRVLESDQVEDLSISGGFLGILGGLQLLIAIGILSQAHWALAGLYLGSVGALVALGLNYHRRLARWTQSRVELTHELIEQLVGQRTRAVQEDPRRRHEAEDRALAGYAAESRRLDRFLAWAGAGLPRGSLILGSAGLLALILRGAPASICWIALGGIMFAQRALGRLSFGLTSLLAARIAWKSAGPLFRAAAQPEESATEAGLAASLRRIPPGETLIEGRNLEFRFSPERRPVLHQAGVQIKAGERVLIEGSSGSGKSTVAALLAGLHRPQGGLLLLGGLDRATLGATAWRRRVCSAPQQHENHLFQGTLALNLLMGREWPAQPSDLADAEAVCRELGLGELIDRMPSGLLQTVGNAGWRLSHGEQSRVFMARALLQGSDLVILDETFAALDPETLMAAMTTVRRRASTVAVVAHP